MNGHLREPRRRASAIAAVATLVVGLALLGSGSSAASAIHADAAPNLGCAGVGPETIPQSLPCTAAPVLTFATPLPGGEVGAVYNSQLAFTGGTAPFTWTISVPSLPTGLSLDATGKITGTPTVAGASSFTVSLKDFQNRVATRAATLTVIAGPAFTFSAPASGVVGTAYSSSLTASGGTSPFNWSVVTGNTLPAGLSLNNSSGLLSGTPTAAGTFTFDVKVTDGLAVIDTKSITLVINKITSIVALTTSASPVTYGTTTTLTATAGPATPTGTVFFAVVPSSGQFANTSVGLGSAPVASGVATMSVLLPAFGANQITATYTGDATHTAVTSSIVTVEVTGYAGEIIVTEFRGSGPDGDNDTYVELYNASTIPVPLGGFALESSSEIITVRNSAAVLPAHQSYLLSGGSDFSLRAIATTDQWRSDLGIGGIKVSAPDTAGTQTDAVGPETDFHRGTGLPAMTGSPTDQYAWVRLSVAGRPKDTGDNAADFTLVSGTGGMIGDVQSTLGSASPTGLSDPFQHNATLQSTLLDGALNSALPPNREYNRATGTLTVRRTITNSSGNFITAAKIRLTALSEANGAPLPGVVNQPATHAALRLVNPAAATSVVAVDGRGDVTVQNLGVDFPATTGGASGGVLPLLGGGLNSTLTVPLPEGLPSGNSIDVAFTFQVDAGGPFWFGYDVDATETPDCSGQGLRTARVRLSC